MATKKQADYQSLSAELDSVLAELQSGELDIDAATKAYERGMVLIGELEAYLKTAEVKIKKVKLDPLA